MVIQSNNYLFKIYLDFISKNNINDINKNAIVNVNIKNGLSSLLLRNIIF